MSGTPSSHVDNPVDQWLGKRPINKIIKRYKNHPFILKIIPENHTINQKFSFYKANKISVR